MLAILKLWEENRNMNRHPFTPNPRYDYEREPVTVDSGGGVREGEAVLALDQKRGVLLGVEYVWNYTIPFLPERLKPMLHEIRIRRAEVRAGQTAEETRKNWNKVWLMGAR